MSIFKNSGLPKELVCLVYLRVSQINGCAYCIDMHSNSRMVSRPLKLDSS